MKFHHQTKRMKRSVIFLSSFLFSSSPCSFATTHTVFSPLPFCLFFFSSRHSPSQIDDKKNEMKQPAKTSKGRRGSTAEGDPTDDPNELQFDITDGSDEQQSDPNQQTGDDYF
jgi:hypothetical protein